LADPESSKVKNRSRGRGVAARMSQADLHFAALLKAAFRKVFEDDNSITAEVRYGLLFSLFFSFFFTFSSF
jgi:hypothetical protein